MALFSEAGWLFLLRWIHFLSGITWIGLLYYFNFVQTPFFAETEAPVRSGAQQKLLPRAMWWFRWGAMFTFITGWLYFFHGGTGRSARGELVACRSCCAPPAHRGQWLVRHSPQAEIVIQNARDTRRKARQSRRRSLGPAPVSLPPQTCCRCPCSSSGRRRATPRDWASLARLVLGSAPRDHGPVEITRSSAPRARTEKRRHRVGTPGGLQPRGVFYVGSSHAVFARSRGRDSPARGGLQAPPAFPSPDRRRCRARWGRSGRWA